MSLVRTIAADYLRFITFRPVSGAVAQNSRAYLLFGLAVTWIVGVGRFWDDPTADLIARSGFASIVYVFALSAFIWMVVAALKPARWTFDNVLLMVVMTAAPGIIYAIPVEKFLPADAARAVNIVFLTIVATWRMALYFTFLRRVAQLPGPETAIAALLPPTIIICILGFFGVLTSIAYSMGGVRDDLPEGAISGQAFLALAGTAFIALPLELFVFVILVIARRQKP